MGSGGGISVCDKLLLAAFSLEQSGKSPFSAEDLVVRAWQASPETFGLRGHNDQAGKPLYPDSNRVFAEIMGAKPIRKRGFLVKVGTKVYQLTDTGRRRANELLRAPGGQKERKLSLSRELGTDLQRLFRSRAVRKVDDGRAQDLSFHDACMFWRITPQCSAIDLEGSLARVVEIVKTAGSALQGGDGQMKHGGPGMSLASMHLLERTHEELLQRFTSELATIRKRIDQRKS